MAFYHAELYPDNIGNGEYDGRGSYALRGVTTGAAYSNNWQELARTWKGLANKTIFGKYPVILNISTYRGGRNEVVARYRLEKDGGRWKQVYGKRGGRYV